MDGFLKLKKKQIGVMCGSLNADKGGTMSIIGDRFNTVVSRSIDAFLDSEGFDKQKNYYSHYIYKSGAYAARLRIYSDRIYVYVEYECGGMIEEENLMFDKENDALFKEEYDKALNIISTYVN